MSLALHNLQAHGPRRTLDHRHGRFKRVAIEVRHLLRGDLTDLRARHLADEAATREKIPEDIRAAILARDQEEMHAGRPEAIVYGHALEGNLHFVFTQDFGQAAEVERYSRFMDALCRMVVGKYDGSLKAEHGTGRNMAPFEELEWGKQATGLMRAIKQALDPYKLMNPGRIVRT